MSLTTKKVIVFLLTFFAYAGLHCIRQGWSYSKIQLQKQFNITSPQFGLVDTLYLFSYSIGMATIGNFSTKINLKYFVSIGIILSSIFYMSFSILYCISHVFNYVFVVIMMCLNGYFQCTGWPGVVGIVGNWFGKGKRGLLMGFWAVNSNIGNIFALVICNIFDQTYQLYWTANFLATGLFTLGIAILCLIFLQQKPNMQKRNILVQQQQSTPQLTQINQLKSQNNNTSIITKKQQQNTQTIITQNNINNQQQKEQQKQINVFTAFFLPRVPFYVIGYACTKGCIYGLLFWLPTYLHNKGMQEQKGYIASMVDVGTFIGGMIVGHLGDKYSLRALFLSPCLFLSAIVMFVVSFAFQSQVWLYYIAMFLIGVFTGGPYNIIGTAIAMDIGEKVGKKNIAKVSALIQGSAAGFAAISQIVISLMPFQAIFYLFSGECLVAGLVLLPLFLKDYKQLNNK